MDNTTTNNIINGKNLKLNFLKMFACLGVILIHFPFPDKFGVIVQNICGYAVPIFMMIAGYYAFGKDSATIKRRLFKIIKIFIVAYIIFLAHKTSIAVFNHELSGFLSEQFTWTTPIKYIVFCTIGFAGPLWYLIAMIEVYVVWFFVVKKEKEHLILCLMPFLFIFQIVLNTYADTAEIDFFWKINFITNGMTWFLLGYSLNTHKLEKIKNLKTIYLIILIIAGCFIAVSPVAFELKLRYGGIGYIPFALGLFALCLKNPEKSINCIIEFIGDKLSLYIYVLHVPIVGLLEFVFKYLFHVDIDSELFRWIRPLLGAVATISLSLIVYLVLNKLRLCSRHSLDGSDKKSI